VLLPQELFAVTLMFPLEPAVAVIEFVVDVPDHPEGSVQVYEVAPVTEAIEYVCDDVWQTVADPVTAPGADGTVLTVMVAVLAALVPQLFTAVTEMVPPDVPAVVVIEFVVDVPDHPEGSVHVYDVAPVTAATEYVWVVPAQTVVLPVSAAGCAGTVLTVI
jgi:hypothetical protein